MTSPAADPTFDLRPLVRRLGKPPAAWQRRDLVDFCLADGIRVVNFRYASFDGKLRELRLPVANRAYLDRILAAGERVDGSSLFHGLFPTGRSDLYVVPVYRWAFLDPWASDELHVVCRFADAEGAPCALTPDNLLADLAGRLRQRTGLALHALAELELYLILERADHRFTGRSQRNYHQSAPYLHGRAIADEMLRQAAAISGAVKYAHGEVGYIDQLASSDPELDGRRVEQYELELDLLPIEDLGCWLGVLRWLIRAIADRHGASATFVPKLDEGMAGSGMHVHLALYDETAGAGDGRNRMRTAGGALSEPALALVGGLLRHAPSLTAFGNTVAGSYLRLVPNQEAPTRLSWGASDRSALLRVPLDFATAARLDRAMNPGEDGPYPEQLARPTIEIRSPDGSAFPQLLLAGLTAAILDGLTDSAAVALARRAAADGGGTAGEPSAEAGETVEGLGRLPRSAVEAGELLARARDFYQAQGFAPALLDRVIAQLRAEADDDLADRLRRLPAAERLTESRRLMHKDLHKH
jgi:glutamine synthetase